MYWKDLEEYGGKILDVCIEVLSCEERLKVLQQDYGLAVYEDYMTELAESNPWMEPSGEPGYCVVANREKQAYYEERLSAVSGETVFGELYSRSDAEDREILDALFDMCLHNFKSDDIGMAVDMVLKASPTVQICDYIKIASSMEKYQNRKMTMNDVHLLENAGKYFSAKAIDAFKWEDGYCEETTFEMNEKEINDYLVKDEEKLAKNPQINELASFLRENNRTSDAENVIAMADYVDRMEEMLALIMQDMGDIKEQMRQFPEKEPLIEADAQMQKQVHGLKQELSAIKNETKETVQNIVTNIKQCGMEGLDGTLRFLKIRERLEAFKEKAEDTLAKVKQSINKIESFGSGMRNAEREMANTIRVFVGKEKKEYGEKRFSKTEFVKKPFLAKQVLLEKLLDFTAKSIDACEKVSQAVRKEGRENNEAEVIQITSFGRKGKHR